MLIFILPYMGRRFLLEFKFRYFPNGRFAKFKFNSVKLTNLGHVAKLNPVYIFNHLNLMGEVYFIRVSPDFSPPPCISSFPNQKLICFIYEQYLSLTSIYLQRFKWDQNVGQDLD